MSKQWFQALAAMTALVCVSTRASAQTWTANLAGANESPANTSPGTGTAVVSLSGTNLSVTVTFANLVAGSTAAHIHCCTAVPFSGTAAVATPVPTFPGFPLGVTGGTYTQVFDLALASSYNPAFLTANGGSVDAARTAFITGLNAGETYLNIHSTTFPGGEIRGFLVTTPEPGSVLLLGTGLVGLGGAVRRRRGPGKVR